VTAEELAALPLRERKKAMIRASILASAEHLFEQRGYDNVTVAEIADAANVSVKTLFVYFRSKEDLAFADTALLDGLVEALRTRGGGTPAEAVGRFLRLAARDDDEPGLERFHRAVGESEALRSRMLRLWAEYEDAFSTALAAEESPIGDPAELRLLAMQLVGIVRSITSAEVRAAVAAGTDAAGRQRLLSAWIDRAVELTGGHTGTR
jgi:AcrR family transcriptional regulator